MSEANRMLTAKAIHDPEELMKLPTHVLVREILSLRSEIKHMEQVDRERYEREFREALARRRPAFCDFS